MLRRLVLTHRPIPAKLRITVLGVVNLYRVFTSRTEDRTTMSDSNESRFMSKEKVQAMRLDYGDQKFDEDVLPAREPFAVFDAWFKEAANTEGIREPNSMTIATCSRDGRPSARVVLLKGYDSSGFRFFTNYESRKGKELEANPYACLVFYWEPLHKQIRIEGVVERIPEKESEEYFHSRPRKSQIGAIVSNQSQVIKSREILNQREKELHEKYNDDSISIPKPNYWGGYVVKPYSVEFWCGKTSRLHDRIVFKKRDANVEVVDNELSQQGEDGWVYHRLSP